MKRDQVIQTFKAHETALRRRGVRRASLFGSVARGEAGPGSDIDIFVELDPAAKMTAFDYADMVTYIQSLFPEPVDVSNHEMLKSHVRPSAERDAVAFAADIRTVYAVTARHPDVPWNKIKAAGNIYRHEYDNVSPAILRAFDPIQK